MSVVCGHNHGFFSCCSVKLYKIINYINDNSSLPNFVDSSNQYKLYRKDNTDVTYEFFEHYDNINIDMACPIHYHHEHQYLEYKKLDKKIIPIVKKYFSPSKKIVETIEKIKENYNIDYDNTVAVYYRGTDKITETRNASYEDYYNRIISFQDKTIIIQSDTTSFIDFIKSKNIKNVVIINECGTSNLNKGLHYEKCHRENFIEMINLFSIFLIISKCKHIICGSSNCSLWMMLYRENAINVQQYLNGKWY
jgi:hypothetical protein